MASIFKQLSSNDVTSTRTLLHEAIPLTGTIVSGTYGYPSTPTNIKNYGHGMFQSVYDYPYLSSSANHIFDITVGYSNDSKMSSSANTINSKKINIYNQMAQVLVGYDKTGSIRQFDADGDFVGTTSDKMKECLFINFSRLLIKDEIKKGSFQMDIEIGEAFQNTVGAAAAFSTRMRINDTSGSDGYFVNSPAGEYGVLFAQTIADGAGALNTAKLENETIGNALTHPACGLIYYQAGVVVLSGSVFNEEGDGGLLLDSGASCRLSSDSAATGFRFVTGSSISGSADAIRNRIYNIQFNNTVELNSTIYFCRANHNEFNYSANPTYLSGSQIRIKTDSTNPPLSFITTIGLYSADNQLLAVGKLSEPLQKDPTTELTLRARLDY